MLALVRVAPPPPQFVFTLIQAASKSWRRLNGRNQLPKVIEGIKFTNGVEVTDAAETSAA